MERPPEPDPTATILRYTILLQPVATDTHVRPRKRHLHTRKSFRRRLQPGVGARRSYVIRDATGSLFNPFHNFTHHPVRRVFDAASEECAAVARSLDGVSRRHSRHVPAASEARSANSGIGEADHGARARRRTTKPSRLENYLRSHYAYNLNLTGKPGDDPLAHFLFETHAGHCEYFASAMAIMLRTLGIPTREVNGFLPGEYNDLGEDYIVRASDAHSWVEVYFPGTGWMTFDPTPPGAEYAGGFFSRLGQYMDWFELSWNEWVINYDFIHQILLAQTMQRTTRSWTEIARSWFAHEQAKGRRWMRSWNNGLRLLIPLAVALFLLALRFDLVVAFARRLWLSWQLRSPELARSNPQLASRLYGELLYLLARRGFARQPTQTPFEFAAAVSQPRLAPAVHEFTQYYTQARYGGAPCDTIRLRALLEQIRSSFASR